MPLAASLFEIAHPVLLLPGSCTYMCTYKYTGTKTYTYTHTQQTCTEKADENDIKNFAHARTRALVKNYTQVDCGRL
jgi:hypothetical protein